jgi:hypothetical protein
LGRPLQTAVSVLCGGSSLSSRPVTRHVSHVNNIISKIGNSISKIGNSLSKIGAFFVGPVCFLVGIRAALLHDTPVSGVAPAAAGAARQRGADKASVRAHGRRRRSY